MSWLCTECLQFSSAALSDTTTRMHCWPVLLLLLRHSYELVVYRVFAVQLCCIVRHHIPRHSWLVLLLLLRHSCDLVVYRVFAVQLCCIVRHHIPRHSWLVPLLLLRHSCDLVAYREIHRWTSQRRPQANAWSLHQSGRVKRSFLMSQGGCLSTPTTLPGTDQRSLGICSGSVYLLLTS